MASTRKTDTGIEFVFKVAGLVKSAKDADIHIVQGDNGDTLEILLPGMPKPATLDIPPEVDTDSCRVKLKKGSGALVISFANIQRAQHRQQLQKEEEPPRTTPASTPSEAPEAKLFASVESGDVHLLQKHLEDRGSPSAMGPGGYPILCVAAASGNTRAVEALLCAGADLEGRTEEDGNSGLTALHAACWNVQEATVKQLLGAGAVADARDDDGETPLMVAARLGSVGIVKLLAEAGADPGARDENEWLAAEKAAVRGHAQVVEFLGDLLPGDGSCAYT